ncbi:MAG: secretion system protein E, partial [Thermoplasmata archaeon]|nr:secretion system protein E [Thermoplasmata archaeon]
MGIPSILYDKKKNVGKRLGAVQKAKRRAYQRMLGDKALKVKAPKGGGRQEVIAGAITPIPPVTNPNMREVELQPIVNNYSYVRILYDDLSNQHFYEVLEPQLTDEEEELLGVLKDLIIENLEMTAHMEDKQRESWLRSRVEGLLRDLGITLHPLPKERIMYFIVRDFVRYGAIDPVMVDPQVEDISCDGVGVPFYIYHRKYGSVPSNIKFESEEELDSYVVWLAQKCGKHISVAQPMLDAS